MIDAADRAQFLNIAGFFEGGLVFVALGLAWLFGIDLPAEFQVGGLAVAAGIGAAVPPYLLLVAADRLRLPPLVRIENLLLDMLGPSLAACRWQDLVALSAVAGFGEELLFRGVLQPAFEAWAPFSASIPGTHGAWILGLVLSNVVFGLLHCVTPTYAILAGLMGLYFGVLLDLTGSRNVVAPIIGHGLYDFLAFQLVVAAQRKRTSPEGGTSDS